MCACATAGKTNATAASTTQPMLLTNIAARIADEAIADREGRCQRTAQPDYLFFRFFFFAFSTTDRTCWLAVPPAGVNLMLRLAFSFPFFFNAFLAAPLSFKISLYVPALGTFRWAVPTPMRFDAPLVLADP